MLLQDRIETGFTLIELVAVILLLSILSVVALSRLGGMDVFEEKAYFDEVTNAFRYAQKELFHSTETMECRNDGILE